MTGRETWELQWTTGFARFLTTPAVSLLLLLAGCTSVSVCDRACLTAEQDHTLYVFLRSGRTIVLYHGLYNISVAGDSGSVTGLGYMLPTGSEKNVTQWNGRVLFSDVDSVEVERPNYVAPVIAIALVAASGVVLQLVGL